ncbi:MAG: glycosyltransferase [Dermatophilaceae bacterium]
MSTGAALAVAVLPVARSMGMPAQYIESLARFDGPSLTGRLLERVPGIRLTAQLKWARRRWEYAPLLLDSFESFAAPSPMPSKIFVTVGTLDKYPFNALVDAVERTGASDADTTWQIGAAKRLPKFGTVLGQVSVAEFDRLAFEADVVVCHAGVGTLLRLWQHGIYPIVVPRRHARGEHVDDHQLQIARLARTHQLALVREVDELCPADFEVASTMRVRASVPAIGEDATPSRVGAGLSLSDGHDPEWMSPVAV